MYLKLQSIGPKLRIDTVKNPYTGTLFNELEKLIVEEYSSSTLLFTFIIVNYHK